MVKNPNLGKWRPTVQYFQKRFLNKYYAKLCISVYFSNLDNKRRVTIFYVFSESLTCTPTHVHTNFAMFLSQRRHSVQHSPDLTAVTWFLVCQKWSVFFCPFDTNWEILLEETTKTFGVHGNSDWLCLQELHSGRYDSEQNIAWCVGLFQGNLIEEHFKCRKDNLIWKTCDEGAGDFSSDAPKDEWE